MPETHHKRLHNTWHAGLFDQSPRGIAETKVSAKDVMPDSFASDSVDTIQACTTYWSMLVAQAYIIPQLTAVPAGTWMYGISCEL